MTTGSHDATAPAPLITCLMVTLAVPQRFLAACASIDAFCRQSYAHKELLLLVNGGTETDRRRLIGHVAGLDHPNIRTVEHAGGITLGALRNLCVEHAGGEILCQWDDDDLHHPERLRCQLEALLQGGHDALFLQEVMQYFPHPQQVYWTNWAATPAGGHPGTLMVRATVGIQYPTDGQDAWLGEDLRVALALRAQGKVGYLAAMPHLFVYVSHGENSWNIEHHQALIKDLAISTGLLRRRETQIRAGLQPFNFPPDLLQVTGASGLAFLL